MAYVPPIAAYSPARITDGVITPNRRAPALPEPVVNQPQPTKAPKAEPSKSLFKLDVQLI